MATAVPLSFFFLGGAGGLSFFFLLLSLAFEGHMYLIPGWKSSAQTRSKQHWHIQNTYFWIKADLEMGKK